MEIKNRIHALLDKYDHSYGCTNLFGKEALQCPRNLNLTSIDQQILRPNLQILETLNIEIKFVTFLAGLQERNETQDGNSD